jgi:DNA-binding transcriptional MerR regulator
MTSSARWTLDELVARVAAALDGPAYPGAPNGRVRDVPDRRAVRWYTTIGLVDRPAAHRGRTALYGPRHLVQLVAVKRLQADGRSLTQIQAELAGATDATLRRLAGVPKELLSADAEPAATRPRFWAQRPEPVDEPAPHDDTVTTLTGVPLPGGAVLLLPARPGRDDLEAIHAAAGPLLDLLADRGLLLPSAGDGPRDHRRPRPDAPRRRVG